MKPVLLAVAAALAGALAALLFWPRAPAFDMAARLAQIAAAQDPWDNQFEHNAAKGQQLADAATVERDPARRLAQRQEAAREFINAGQPEAAVQLLKPMVEDAALPEPQRAALRLDLALAYLRMGEAQNCVLNHNADSCLLPLAGGGIHAVRLGATEAAAQLAALLDSPALDAHTRPTAQWLLNLAYMALGEWPDAVPARWRIPERAFDSAYPLPRFRDTAVSRGLNIVGRAGGAILDDLEGDGWLDVMVSSWGQQDPLRVFRNGGGGRFTESDPGLPGIDGGLDIYQADYDNDGRLDVFVPRGAWTHKAGVFPGSLLHNEGKLKFHDVTAQAGVIDELPSQAAAWCDFDGDGWLDLVKGNELHQDQGWPATTPNVRLWRNRRDGSFEDVRAASGLSLRGMIKGVVCGDYDNDGRPDLYFSVIYGANHLYRNLGGMKFEDVTQRAGVAAPVMSFTTWFFDYDNDGWEDLFVTGYIGDMTSVALPYLGRAREAQGERLHLYHNDRDGRFTDVTAKLGLAQIILTMGANYGDLDNDGWLDFYLGTGAPPQSLLDPGRMFRNDHGRRFQDVTTAGGFGHLQKGHGVAFGDMDNDGDQDVFEEIGGAFTGDRFWSVLFENPLNDGGKGNDWITLRLRGVKANRSAIGARIRVHLKNAEGERDLWNTVSSGGSFGASSLQAEIGLGREATIESITIRWPGSGTVQEIHGPLAVRKIYEVVEGEAPKEVQLPKR